jgi:glycyl-tRNA synthetase (class II)
MWFWFIDITPEKIWTKNKLLNESSHYSKHTADIRTIAFAAPEVLNGGNYDTKSDAKKIYKMNLI